MTLNPSQSRFGGFLLLATLLHHSLHRCVRARPALKCVERADDIGVFLDTAFHTFKPRLSRAILLGDVTAGQARPVYVLRRYWNQSTAVPGQFILQLAAELESALNGGLAKHRVKNAVGNRLKLPHEGGSYLYTFELSA